MKKLYIIIISVIIVGIIYYINIKPNKFFYNTSHQYFKFLDNINNYKNNIYNETMNINTNWNDWPETNLYNKEKGNNWKIFPFYGFGNWVDINCKRCPTIYNFIKTIPNLKLATLSKLTAGTKLEPHRGWGSHSNYVLRCHYGISVPDNCYISVSNTNAPPLYYKSELIKKSYPNNYIHYDFFGQYEEIQFHKQFKWIIFDDSETHYAENLSNSDRIVLIIDLLRPPSIKNGSSEVGDTSELLQIIDYYKKYNIEIT